MKRIMIYILLYLAASLNGQLTAQVYVNSDGFLGVGNNSPTSNLVIGNDLQLYPALFGNTYLTIADAGFSDESALIIGTDFNNFTKIVWNEGVNELRFDMRIGGVPSIGLLLLNDNGCVGIRNPSLEASELLSVGEDFGTALGGNRITIGNASGYSGLNLGEDIDNRAFMLWENSNNLLSFGTRSAATTYSQTLVLRNGKIGIKNGDPLYDLHVGNGNITALNGSNTRMVVSDNDNGQRAAVLGLANTGGGARVEAQLEANGSSTSGPSVIMGAASSHPLYIRTANLTRMTISSDGNVGIGTLSPGWLLEVNGTAAKPGGGSWTSTSDLRLKKEVRDYDQGLEEILRIRPVYFHYNRLSGYDTGLEHVGVIAQELNEVAPAMVGSIEIDGNDYLTVDNSAMTYMLINAVKELKREIESLKEENAKLQERMAGLGNWALEPTGD